MESKTCKTCKHWEQLAYYSEQVPEPNTCLLISREVDAPYVTGEGSELVTPANFGCSLWEKQNTGAKKRDMLVDSLLRTSNLLSNIPISKVDSQYEVLLHDTQNRLLWAAKEIAALVDGLSSLDSCGDWDYQKRVRKILDAVTPYEGDK